MMLTLVVTIEKEGGACCTFILNQQPIEKLHLIIIPPTHCVDYTSHIPVVCKHPFIDSFLVIHFIYNRRKHTMRHFIRICQSATLHDIT